MDFLRNVRVSSLVEQFTYWDNQANMNKFYNNLPHIKSAEFGVSKYQDGYIWFKNGTLTYNNLLNGSTIKLRKKWKDTDYISYTEMQKVGAESGSFKFDVPVYRDIVEVNGTMVEYIEFNSPIDSHGAGHSDIWLSKNKLSVSDFTDLMSFYVVTAGEVFKAATEISRNNNCGIPSELCKIINFYKDNDQWIVTESMDWSTDFDDAIAAHLTFFGQFLEKMKVYQPGVDIEAIKSNARNTWIRI